MPLVTWTEPRNRYAGFIVNFTAGILSRKPSDSRPELVKTRLWWGEETTTCFKLYVQAEARQAPNILQASITAAIISECIAFLTHLAMQTRSKLGGRRIKHLSSRNICKMQATMAPCIKNMREENCSGAKIGWSAGTAKIEGTRNEERSVAPYRRVGVAGFLFSEGWNDETHGIFPTIRRHFRGCPRQRPPAATTIPVPLRERSLETHGWVRARPTTKCGLQQQDQPNPSQLPQRRTGPQTAMLSQQSPSHFGCHLAVVARYGRIARRCRETGAWQAEREDCKTEEQLECWSDEPLP